MYPSSRFTVKSYEKNKTNIIVPRRRNLCPSASAETKKIKVTSVVNSVWLSLIPDT